MSYKMFIITVVLCLVCLLIRQAKSCGGVEIQTEYHRNCDSDNVVELSSNFSVTLSNDCFLHFQGCVTNHENITTAEVAYTVEKNMVKYSGKKDGCKKLEEKAHDFEVALDLMKLPQSCPISKGTFCMDSVTIDVSKYKSRMNILLGNIKGRSVTTINGGGKTCVEFSANIVNSMVQSLPHRKFLPVIG
ncbi:uncharacterized protein LOC126895079 [Daktulosphaira vitifoliae]|uniref:uncharacterized protein LOC126895079 n=1 Tax=Daktulosphaira vitifoliae TaxID=58002 RepID=UPI0021AAC343|nr:uncharacterized protein LOC126895079 [Daktulosphaira vitifoliae]